MAKLILTILAAVTLTGCLYRMPRDEDDEFRCVPTTNNPSVTRDSGQTLLPGQY